MLPSESDRGEHYQCDVLDLISVLSFDLMIAFPPCTHLAVSGASHFAQKRKDGRQQQSIDFFIALACADIDKICIENPIGVMSTKWRKPDQIIQPFQFGDPYKKSTCLWLKKLLKLTPTNIVDPEIVLYKSKKTKSGYSAYSHLGKLGSGKGKERSIMPIGLANAMADQWG